MRRIIYCILAISLMLPGMFGCGNRTISPNAIIPEFSERLLPKKFREFMDLDWELQIHPGIDGEILQAWIEYDVLFIETELKRDGDYYFKFIAINRENGNMIWNVELRNPIQFRPVVTTHAVYLVSDNKLVSIERVSGLVRWTINPKDFTFGTRPAIIEPSIYPDKMEMGVKYNMEQVIAAGFDGTVRGMQVVGSMQTLAPAITTAGVTENAIVEPIFQIRLLWFQTTNGDISWEPIVYDNNIYFVSTDSYVYCMSIDGEEKFKRRLQGPIRSPVRASDDSIYFASEDSFMYSYVAGEDVQKWVHSLQGMVTRNIFIDHNDPKNKLIFVPVRPLALAPEDSSQRARMVCIRHELEPLPEGTEENLSKRRYENHETLWETKDAMEVLAISKEIVYFGGSSLLPGIDYDTIRLDLVIAVEKKTGNELWFTKMPGIIKQLIPNDQKIDSDRINLRRKTRMYAITNNNYVLCFVEPSTDSGPYNVPDDMMPTSDEIERE